MAETMLPEDPNDPGLELTVADRFVLGQLVLVVAAGMTGGHLVLTVCLVMTGADGVLATLAALGTVLFAGLTWSTMASALRMFMGDTAGEHDPS